MRAPILAPFSEMRPGSTLVVETVFLKAPLPNGVIPDELAVFGENKPPFEYFEDLVVFEGARTGSVSRNIETAFLKAPLPNGVISDELAVFGENKPPFEYLEWPVVFKGARA